MQTSTLVRWMKKHAYILAIIILAPLASGCAEMLLFIKNDSKAPVALASKRSTVNPLLPSQIATGSVSVAHAPTVTQESLPIAR
jgi:hypothetical protein